MARIRRRERLSKQDQESLLFDLIQAIVQSKNVNEAALFLQDLLTKSEILAISKRLRIAKMLISGSSYENIEQRLSVSHGTIAKIAAWLTDRGEGFRKVISKIPKEPEPKDLADISDWDRIKRRHGLYFWPELVIEEIIKSSNKKQKDRIKAVLETVDQKSQLYKQLDKLLKV
ncbi:MAG: hypothetical protein HY426_01695 [Candidatus Levybacteria bacterium]|nr:hypothetical protein [Candidatus Levybacteria bacterium]